MQLLSFSTYPGNPQIKEKPTMAIFCSLITAVSSDRIAEAEEIL